VKPLGEVRRIAVARKLSAISETATHAKTLIGGGVMAETRKLPFFTRRAPLDIRRWPFEGTRRGE